MLILFANDQSSRGCHKSYNRIPLESRHQQVLDLSNEDAFLHVYDKVSSLLIEHRITYIKWDHNRFLLDPGHHGKPAVHKQTLAIYRLMDMLKKAAPGLEIESCSSGGGRIDLGILEHCDRFWTSDNNDALERQMIQCYTSIVIPPELLGCHVGPLKAHSTGRVLSLHFRCVTALFGHAGIEMDLTHTNPRELTQLQSWASYYKKKRELLHNSKVVRVDSSDSSVHIHGVIAHDQSEAIFAIVQMKPSRMSRPSALRIPGLQSDGRYSVRVVNDFGEAETMQLAGPKWMQSKTCVAVAVVAAGATGSSSSSCSVGVVESVALAWNGDFLQQIGLPSPVLRPEQALLIEIKRLD